MQLLWIVVAGCLIFEVECGNGECVPYTYMCDCYLDCFNGADEENCGGNIYIGEGTLDNNNDDNDETGEGRHSDNG